MSGGDANPALPRGSLALTSAAHAFVLAWAATTLPWREGTSFALASGALAALHALNALLASWGARQSPAVWRVTAWGSLAYLGWLTWCAADAAVTVSALYGGLGQGVAVAIAVVGGCVALFTLPFGCWGLARTGGVPAPRRAVLIGLLVVAGALLARSAAQARATPVVAPDEDAEADLATVLAEASAEPGDAPFPSVRWPLGPSRCKQAPGPGVATALVSWRTAPTEAVRSRCVQAVDPAGLAAAVGSLLAAERAAGPVALDWVTGVAPLVGRGSLLAAFSLRPGLDGVCAGRVCLAPWQLLAADRFTTHTPLAFVPDLRFGVSPDALRAALHADESESGELLRIETRSLRVAGGRAEPLRRLHEAPPPLDAESLESAWELAERHVATAVGEAGRMRYRLQPFSGERDLHTFDPIRQAGATLVLCELGRDPERTREAAARSLAALAALERPVGHDGKASALVASGASQVGLGSAALPLLAFLRCRERVGDARTDGPEAGPSAGVAVGDARLARLAETLLALERSDGSFRRGLDVETGAPIPGGAPLYAAGQAIFALSELEALATRLESAGSSPLPPAERLRDATERAMSHTARGYWDHALADFFFLEENWHCLAARASLGHHRHDGYERFCLDYVAFKSRLVLDAVSRVDEDLVGGYGFGNVLPPHNTSSAGFAEALAAAIEVRRARGLDVVRERRLLAEVLRFLLRQQWTAASCFACATPEAVGGFSESMASPTMRIDYVQHAWAALGHGGRILLDPVTASR